MTKHTNPQSQKRFQDSLGSLFRPFSQVMNQKSLLFLKSSSDQGVIRNGGRNGARFAPQSFLACFKKLVPSERIQDWTFSEIEVASDTDEKENFAEAQKKEAEKMTALLKSGHKGAICHLGGGHDHIYPLLTAFGSFYQKIVVINLDAHADTRTDLENHSGTPFRQFANQYSGTFHLFQIGLHPWANSLSTLSPLTRGKVTILWKKDLNEDSKITEFFTCIKALVDDQTLVIFSLDADALKASEVPAVSAVNGDGLTRAQLVYLWKEYRKLTTAHEPILGIYELNPVFDTLSSISMRTLSTFVFEGLG